VKTVSDRVVRHSFAYLSVYIMIAGVDPFYVKIWQILTHTCKTPIFQSFFACSASR